MTDAQYTALATLLRMRDPSREAARLVLVQGMRPADAARATGMSAQGASNAVTRARRGLELVRVAAGPASVHPVGALVCDECGRSSFACSNCGTETAIDDTIDVFHVGTCPNCRDRDAQPCQGRMSPTTASRCAL